MQAKNDKFPVERCMAKNSCEGCHDCEGRKWEAFQALLSRL